MRIGSMLTDVAKSFIQRPITEKYPYICKDPPERLRSHLYWESQNCTGCGMCERDCPAQALEVHVIDKKSKRIVLRYHLDRCAFCAQCVFTCMKNCISIKNDVWELASLDKQKFTQYYGQSKDVEQIMAGTTPE